MDLAQVLTEAHSLLDSGQGDRAWELAAQYFEQRSNGVDQPTMFVHAFQDVVEVGGDEYANALMSNARLDSSERWALVSADLMSVCRPRGNTTPTPGS